MSEKTNPQVTSVVAVLAAACTLACITINVYFPEAEVRNLSEQIEEAVRERAGRLEISGPDSPEEEAPPTGGGAADSSSPPLRLAILLQASSVPRAEVTSPAIERIIESRAARLAELERFKGLAVLGEGNDARLVLRSLDPLSELRDRAQAQRLVKEENADREKLFQEIASIKAVDRTQLPRIRETYAATLRAHARKGDWIQLPSGEWAQASGS